MLISLKPRHRERVLIFIAFALLVAGAKIGVTFHDKSVAANITPLTRVKTSEPVIGVMVDVSQATAESVAQCLGVFESAGIKATWFCSATFAEAHDDLIQQIIDNGHELGLSGTDDKAMDRLDDAEIELRLVRAREALIKTAEPMPFFYAPAGRFNKKLVNAAFEQGFYSVKGSIDGKALRGKVDSVVRKVGGSAKPGDILIIRIGKKGMVPKPEYIENLATYLKIQGMSMVSLSTLVRGIR